MNHNKRYYTIALTRNVPTTMSQALSTHQHTIPSSSVFSLSKAIEQHNTYVSTLRSIIPTFTLPAEDTYPDCSFIEDTAIVIGNRALITQLGATSRRGEVNPIHLFLESFGMNVTTMKSWNPIQKDHALSSSSSSSSSDNIDNDDVNLEIPTCDGGDVLCPIQNNHTYKKDLFVGVSHRTNPLGLHVIQQVFYDLNVIPVPVLPEETKCLHLKSFMTLLDENTLLIPKGNIFDFIIEEIQVLQRGYKVIRLPNPRACNVVHIHKHILAPFHENEEEEEEESRMILQTACKERGLTLHGIDTSEFEKFDSAMTCKSLLLSL